MPKTPTQTKNWCFTINNPEFEPSRLPSKWPEVKYAVWQLEQGENKTPHLQGLVQFKTNQRFNALKKLGDEVHWEATLSVQASIEYCQKEEGRLAGPWTIGTPPQQGARNDLLAVQEKLDKGASIKQIYQEHFIASSKYHQFFKEYKRVCTEPRSQAPLVEWIYGPTGTGKSHYALTQEGRKYWMGAEKWFDDYDNEDILVMDEYHAQFKYSYLLRLLDKYPLLVEVKHGHVQFTSSRIIILSNKAPWEFYTHCDLDPLKRRIKVYHKKSVNSELEFVPWEPINLPN